jgi:hypothetical protein
VCQGTGALLEDFQIRTYFPMGGERVFITKQEMGQIKQLGDMGMVKTYSLIFLDWV